MKIIIIDNYDSFTYNLSHLVKEIGAQVSVIKNDQFKLTDLAPYDKILLSPGPGIPSESGLLLNVIQHYAGKKPILGVCLGEQAIGQVFGAEINNLYKVYHGIQSLIDIDTEDYLFHDLPDKIQVGRYHSWIVSNKNFPSCLKIIANSPEGYIMAIKHNEYDIRGIQFHPESILTPNGKNIISNWINH